MFKYGQIRRQPPADGQPYFTMEFVESGSLSQQVAGTPQPTQQVLAEDPLPPSQLNSRVPRDLETICLKCLPKEPQRRYSSARELADDLGRFLRGELVAAQRDGVAERLRKWVWRRPAAAGLLAALVLLAAAGGVGAWQLYWQQARLAQTNDDGASESGGVASNLGDPVGTTGAFPIGRMKDERQTVFFILHPSSFEAADRRKLRTFFEELLLRYRDSPEVHVNLGVAACVQKKYRAAEAAFRKAIDLRPDYAVAYHNLGSVLSRQGKHVEAEAAYHKALALKPDRALTYHNLGITLVRQERYSEGEAACRKAVNLMPNSAASSVYFDLGTSLREQHQYREAEAAFREAIGLKPDYPDAYNDLGNVLLRQQKAREAESAYHKAIALKPDHAAAYNNLGKVLLDQQKHTEAEAAFRMAVAFLPDFAQAYDNLGRALNGQQKHAQAEVAFRKAIDLKPDFALAYFNLGNALSAQGQHAKAEAAFRKSIDLRADHPEAYNNLGAALFQQQKLAEAEAAFRKATDLKPDFGVAHLSLGIVLMRRAKFHEAGASLKRAADLLPAKGPSREQARRLQQQCQRYAILDSKLPAILLGTEKPANAAELIDLADLCRCKKNHATAAGFSRDAFAADPKLAENAAASTRYNAACAAALAGCGRGEDADKLDDKVRAHWRRQALDWLRQDLIWWRQALAKGNAQTNADIRSRLRHWQADGDLACVRVRDALVRLPDEERKQWERFWSDVDALSEGIRSEGMSDE